MITDINSEARLVQKTFADHQHDHLGWETPPKLLHRDGNAKVACHFPII
ncbi:MAG: hypothetical protein Q7J31_15900 [Syntrophales bacterium]|nr:hypothetical protein [Syntrophales bacterium]